MLVASSKYHRHTSATYSVGYLHHGQPSDKHYSVEKSTHPIKSALDWEGMLSASISPRYNGALPQGVMHVFHVMCSLMLHSTVRQVEVATYPVAPTLLVLQ